MSESSPVPAKPGEAVFITTSQVLARYGKNPKTTKPWLWRQLRRDPAFPRPIMIGGLNYWRLADLEAYERAEARRAPGGMRHVLADAAA